MGDYLDEGVMLGVRMAGKILKPLGKAAVGGVVGLAKAGKKLLQNPEADLTAMGGDPPSELASLDPQGFIFGHSVYGPEYLVKRENQDGHILILGGSGSGKSSCLAIPSLMSWKSRVFAIDIKGELSERTKNRRLQTKIFNPFDPSTAGFNPFYILQNSRNVAQDAREIALAMIQGESRSNDPYWIQSAQTFLTGAIIHFYTQGKNFNETVRAIQSTPPVRLIEEIAESESEEARMYVNQLVGMDPKTIAGVYSEISNHIMIFAVDRDIRESFERANTITPQDLEEGYDIFITIPEDKLEQWKSLLTLIVNQFMKHFERRSEGATTPILFLLDEFPRLGKIEAIRGLATLRSRKITICIIGQSLAQFDEIYGHDSRKVVCDNCVYKVIINATDADTQSYFSRMVGQYDKARITKGQSFDPLTKLRSGISETESSEVAPVIQPHEFATLKEMVLLTPQGFFRAKKTPYYETKAFMC